MSVFDSGGVEVPASSVPPVVPGRRSIGSVFLAFLIHHNPFYLLSALSMIAGCYALNSALQTHAGELGKLFLLLGTLNVYELLLIGLALYLIVRHQINRDGRTLLLLQTVFLVDLTFLNSETAATSWWAGIAVNGALMAFAFVKVGFVLRVLLGRLPVQSYLFICTQILALAAIPCGLKWAERHGSITDGLFYASWWIAGLLLFFYELQTRLWPAVLETGIARSAGVGRQIRLVYQVVPYLSLLAHLGMLHWVYKQTFYLAYASPVLLGGAVLLARRSPGWLRDLGGAAGVRFLLPVVAILTSFSYPIELALTSRWLGRLEVTPLLLTLAVAYLVYIYLYVVRYALLFIGGAIAGVLALMFGPTLNQFLAVIDATWGLIGSALRRVIPDTAAQWGIAAVCSAFAFLGIGAGISLHKRKPVE